MNRLSVNQLVVLRSDWLIQNVTAAAFFDSRTQIRFGLLLLISFAYSLQGFFNRLKLRVWLLILLQTGESKVIKLLRVDQKTRKAYLESSRDAALEAFRSNSFCCAES